MKYVLVAATLVLSAFGALAQSLVPLTDNTMLVAEFSRNVSLGGNDKNTWSDYIPRDMNWSVSSLYRGNRCIAIEQYGFAKYDSRRPEV